MDDECDVCEEVEEVICGEYEDDYEDVCYVGGYFVCLD